MLVKGATGVDWLIHCGLLPSTGFKNFVNIGPGDGLLRDDTD